VVDHPGWNPEDYEAHRQALGYLNAKMTSSDSAVAEAYLRSLLDEAEDGADIFPRMLAAMGSLAAELIVVRAGEMGTPITTTLTQLGKLIAPPD
jgi:hypothetical protein